MKASYYLSLFLIIILCSSSCATSHTARIQTGAQQIEQYLPLLTDRNVGILTNNTATIGDTHLVDTLIARGINVSMIFAPEHGFRGDADAGAGIDSSKDAKTGVPIISVYGSSFIPADSLMQQLDVAVFDIQDVGLRFYTYLSSLYYYMEACARNNVPLIILDRPNPNGHMVSGPILDMKYRSFVGIIPVPVVHGMTFGEIAGMILDKKWLPDGLQTNLQVIKCKNYTHQSRYILPIKPSPNLPNNRSIYLYPSLCPFEATPVSVGRGTDFPFQVYGHPDLKDYTFSFTPEPKPGAMNPLRNGEICLGVDLRTEPSEEDILQMGFSLRYVVDAYQKLNNSTQIGEKFFRSNFFEKLVGVSYVREMILQNKSAEEIEAMWQDQVRDFKIERRKYLLYPDIEN